MYIKRPFLLITLLLGSAIAVFAQPGKIAGRLTYPGDGIPPDLTMCVKRTDLYAEPTYCSNDRASRLRAANVIFRLRTRGAAYDVTVPAGTYLIWATTSEMPGVRAYYDEFTRCGMTVRCKSKSPVTVRVRRGQTTAGIKVGDFW